MNIVTNQLGLALIKNEFYLIQALALNIKTATVRPYNSTLGRWLPEREISRDDIKHSFYHVGGKPQTLTAPKEQKRKAA